MNKLYFTPGCKVNVLDRTQVHDEHGWEHRTKNNKGVFHSIVSNDSCVSALVEIDMGDRLCLFDYPLNDIWIDSEKDK